MTQHHHCLIRETRGSCPHPNTRSSSLARSIEDIFGRPLDDTINPSHLINPLSIPLRSTLTML